jgi:hypothetical protein
MESQESDVGMKPVTIAIELTKGTAVDSFPTKVFKRRHVLSDITVVSIALLHMVKPTYPSWMKAHRVNIIIARRRNHDASLWWSGYAT